MLLEEDVALGEKILCLVGVSSGRFVVYSNSCKIGRSYTIGLVDLVVWVGVGNSLCR